MKAVLILVMICVGMAYGEEAISSNKPAAPVPGKNLWRISLTTVAVANALDIHSSWGKRELNPLLASPSGRFGHEGALIKLALQGGLIGVEYLVTRGRPNGKLYRALSFINFGATGALAGTAIHNYGVPRPR